MGSWFFPLKGPAEKPSKREKSWHDRHSLMKKGDDLHLLKYNISICSIYGAS